MLTRASRARHETRVMTVIDSTASMAATIDGIWYPEVRVGDRVRVGQRMGRITDVYGRMAAEIVAPATSRVAYLTVTPPVRKGESLASLAVRERRVRVP